MTVAVIGAGSAAVQARVDARRRAMQVAPRAMRSALAMIPAPEPFGNARAVLDAKAADPETDEELREAWLHVKTYERLHSDILLWAPGLAAEWLGVTDPAVLEEMLDGLFVLAMAIEAQDDAAKQQAYGQLLAALGA